MWKAIVYQLRVRCRRWHLLVAVTAAVLLLGWFTYRLAYVQYEAQAVAGDWVMVNENGDPVYDASGNLFHVTFSRDGFTIRPFAKPRQIDFHTPSGISKGIYEWDNDRLHVLQASEGMGRPHSFSDKITDFDVTTSTMSGTYSLTPFLLQRATK